MGIKMKIYAFSDIHGEFNKLKVLMERVHPEKNDKLVFLGDYIDRGNMTFEVIELLIDLDKKHDCVFLQGNHENMFMDYMSGIYERMFIYNGGTKTIESYGEHGWEISSFDCVEERNIPLSHMEFFKNQPKYYETEDYIFVHAGIVPGVPLKDTDPEIFIWDRDFTYSDYKGKVVVFGHTPSAEVLDEEYKICIDTGACFSSIGMGYLTCVKLPDRTFIKQGCTLEDMDYGNNN